MSITIGGRTYTTLNDKLNVNGKRIVRAEVNGSKVYPEGFDGSDMWCIRGHGTTVVFGDGQNYAARDRVSVPYWISSGGGRLPRYDATGRLDVVFMTPLKRDWDGTPSFASSPTFFPQQAGASFPVGGRHGYTFSRALEDCDYYLGFSVSANIVGDYATAEIINPWSGTTTTMTPTQDAVSNMASTLGVEFAASGVCGFYYDELDASDIVPSALPSGVQLEFKQESYRSLFSVYSAMGAMFNVPMPYQSSNGRIYGCYSQFMVIIDEITYSNCLSIDYRTPLLVNASEVGETPPPDVYMPLMGDFTITE